MRKASLFSGIGGIDLAAHWAGMETVVFCEREPFPQRVLRKHWPHVPIIDDVREVTREELEKRGVLGNGRTIDIISAGYPCQPFSVAGKRAGAEDDRHLWPEVKRILEEIRPRWFVGENVAGHVSLGLDDVLSDLESLIYTAQAFVIPAAAVRASHRRDRVFIVGYTEHDGSHRATIGRGADKASNNHPKREDEAREPSGASGRSGDASLPNASCGQCNTGAEVKGILRILSADGPINGDVGGRGAAQSRQNVAHTYNERCKERFSSTGDGEPGQHPGRINAGRVHGEGRATQPGMGRGDDELSDWLDGLGRNPLDVLIDFIANYPQPALMGQPQYEWEPPRVATGVKNRVARLKALGNAVDPLQIFPIMYAIKVIDDWLNGGTPWSTNC